MNKTNWSVLIEKKFWSKVIIPKDIVNECWIWNHRIDKGGYGIFWFNGNKRAHRLSYEYFNGKIKNNLHICHSCDNPICVNPNHLWMGTNLQNQQDKVKKGRSTIKHDDQIIIDILNKIQNGEIKSYAGLSKEKVSPGNIMGILRGEYRYNFGELFDLEELRSKIRGKFTDQEVIQIKNRLKNGESCTSISRSFNCFPNVISKIKNKNTFKHIEI